MAFVCYRLAIKTYESPTSLSTSSYNTVNMIFWRCFHPQIQWILPKQYKLKPPSSVDPWDIEYVIKFQTPFDNFYPTFIRPCFGNEHDERIFCPWKISKLSLYHLFPKLTTVPHQKTYGSWRGCIVASTIALVKFSNPWGTWIRLFEGFVPSTELKLDSLFFFGSDWVSNTPGLHCLSKRFHVLRLFGYLKIPTVDWGDWSTSWP